MFIDSPYSALTNEANKSYMDHLMSLFLGNILCNTRRLNVTSGFHPRTNNGSVRSSFKNLYFPQLSDCGHVSNSSSVIAAPPLLLLANSNAKVSTANLLLICSLV